MSDPNIVIFILNIVNNENVANECSSLVTPLYIYIRNVACCVGGIGACPKYMSVNCGCSQYKKFQNIWSYANTVYKYVNGKKISWSIIGVFHSDKFVNIIFFLHTSVFSLVVCCCGPTVVAPISPPIQFRNFLSSSAMLLHTGGWVGATTCWRSVFFVNNKQFHMWYLLIHKNYQY